MPAAARLAALALLAAPPALAAAGDAAVETAAAVETDDAAVRAIRQAVQARDAEALLRRVGGAGVEGSGDQLVSPGWVRRHLTKADGPVAAWVFGPAAPPKGPAPWSMAACLAGEVDVQRTSADAATVRCRRDGRAASFGLTRHEGRWAITRDFFWPDEAARAR